MNICKDKNKCCCFTGHRPHKLGISEKKAKELLSDAVDDMIEKVDGGFDTSGLPAQEPEQEQLPFSPPDKRHNYGRLAA